MPAVRTPRSPRSTRKTGRPRTLVNAQNEPTTPSVVLLDGSRLVVGTAALDAVGVTSENVALHIKRDLGRNLFHLPLSGQEYPPEVLLALILNKVAEDGRRADRRLQTGGPGRARIF